jgi:hypothetical protein
MAVRTKAELKKALGAVIYEMLMLESAIQQIERGGQKYYGLRFGDEEAAYLAGLIKVRSLFDFLADRYMQKYKERTIRILEFSNGSIWNPPAEVEAFRNFANGFVAHIGWERVERGKGKPTRKELERHGRVLLRQAETFVEQNKDVYGFTKTSAKYYNYYRHLQSLRRSGTQ